MQASPTTTDCRGFGKSLLRSPHMARVAIGHALVDDCLFLDACGAIVAHASRNNPPAFVVTPNAQHIVLLHSDPVLREIYSKADLVVADGISLLLASRLSGRALRERIAGVDMFRRLCAMAAEQNLRVFLLGGRPGSADSAAHALRLQFPALDCATYCPPLGFEQDEAEMRRIDAAISTHHPHLLFVAFGAPKQESWIYSHGLQLDVPVSIGVGGSFEMVGGIVRRAPQWIQKLGCEWLYRLVREPRRLWRRYTVGNLQFASIVAAQRMRRALLNACVRVASGSGFAAELNEIAIAQTGRVSEVLSVIAQEAIRDSVAV